MPDTETPISQMNCLITGILLAGENKILLDGNVALALIFSSGLIFFFKHIIFEESWIKNPPGSCIPAQGTWSREWKSEQRVMTNSYLCRNIVAWLVINSGLQS